MTLADSTVWIDYFRGLVTWQTDRLDALLATEPVAVADVILTEVLQGFRDDDEYRSAKATLSALPFFSVGGYARAVAAADNSRLLRKRGITIRKTIDVLIATLCLDHDFELLHNDRDFEPMETELGLRVHKE